MKKLIYRLQENEATYPDDVDRIVSICWERGYEISKNDAIAAWEDYSDMMCAGWMRLDDDDDAIFSTIMGRCDVVEEWD